MKHCGSVFKLICICLTLSLLGVSGIPASSETFSASDGKRELIEHYFDCINNGEWEQWAECYAPEFRSDRQLFIGSLQNFESNLGILTVNHAEILGITPISPGYICSLMPELEPYSLEPDNFDCFLVKLNVTVNEENDSFQNGKSSQLIGLVRIDGQWFVAALCACPEKLPEDVYYEVDNPISAVKNSVMSRLTLDFPRLSSASDKTLFSASFLMPVRKRYLASPAYDGFADAPYMLEWLSDDTDNSVYYLNDGNAQIVGAVGFSYCNSVLGGKMLFDYSTPESLIMQNTYVDLFLQEFPLDTYESIDLKSSFVEILDLNDDYSSVTILTRCEPRLLENGESSSANVVILSYIPKLGVFLGIELDPSHFTAMEIVDIASSIEFTWGD